MAVEVVILAAGLGTRLRRDHPKPLTRLANGRTILAQQLDRVHAAFGAQARVTIVVGHRRHEIRVAFPGVDTVCNPAYARTNTARSLLHGLHRAGPGGVLWMNGDVVFDEAVLPSLAPAVGADRTFVCVDTSPVGEEEVTYTLDSEGWLDRLAKRVAGGIGEAVGINYVAAAERPLLERHLAACADDDYFERALELAVARDGLRVLPLDVSAFGCIEVDVEEDLARANLLPA